MNSVQVELIGCTNAGKSTLAQHMVKAFADEGKQCVLDSDRVAGLLGLGKTKNKLLRAMAIHVMAGIGCLFCIRRYVKFVRFSFGVLRRMPIPRWQRWNQFRKVLKQLGCFEILRRREHPETVVIVDEGTIHAGHNLFVHVGGQLDRREITSFAELLPLPDVVVCVRDAEDKLVERIRQRQHPRVPRSASREVRATFVRDALETFNLLSQHKRIAPRTILVDGREIFLPSAPTEDRQVKLVARILQRAIAMESEHVQEDFLTQTG